MRVEYRYKASVAMALEGYKREAGEVDPSLVLKLMEGAVHHFAENPALRVHKSNAPATPLHDAFERLRGTKESKEVPAAQAQTPTQPIALPAAQPIRPIAAAPTSAVATPA